MIKFFRQIRQKMLTENKVSKYLIYAIGEIILVVIGILIALQINNNNEVKKQRDKELHYLENIKKDLYLNIAQLDDYIAIRTKAIESATIIVEHFEGKPITDYDAFSVHTIDIYTWRKFFQTNNTFQELVNSGNLALISDDSIKNILLNMESLYKLMKDEEAHFRYDAEILLYEPSYSILDLNSTVQNYTYKVTNGKAGKKIDLPRKQFEVMLQDLKQKNGFVLAAYEFGVMNQQFEKMKLMCEQLIDLINIELTE